MAAQGRGSVPLFLLLLPLACLRTALGTVYTVGGAQGWDLGVEYTTWAAGKALKVGDVLFFPYTQTVHNVVVVNKAGYDACSDANAITTLSAGNDNVTLTSAGTHYYICSVVGHCSGGMKLTVTVSAVAAAAPTTTPAPAPVAANTPPSTTPSPTTESPASAPTPVFPVPAPAPGPAVGTPPVESPATSPIAPGLPPTTSAGTPQASSPPPPPNAAPPLRTAATIALLSLILASLFAL